MLNHIPALRYSVSHRSVRVIFLGVALFAMAMFAFPLAAQQIRINEVMASNATILADENGDYEDWIELHNAGVEPVNLEGWGLSDNYGQPFRWTFPSLVIGPDEYLLIWASGKNRRDPGVPLHTSYSISSSGEEVILTHPDGTLVDELPPTAIPGDLSIGRLPGEGDAWFFFDEPTPGAANTTPGYDEILAPPVFSSEGGFYTDPVTLTLSAPEGVTILYTLDGTEPNPNEIGGTTYQYKNSYPFGSLLTRTLETRTYSAPILIEDRSGHTNSITGITTRYTSGPHSPPGSVFSGTPVRAIAVRDGALPSRLETHTFFVSPNAPSRYQDILVLSIVTDERNLFDYDSGIYVAGRLADEWAAANSGFDGWSMANYQVRSMPGERAASLEVFESGSDRVLSQGIGVRAHGGWSRYFADRKSIRLYARNQYDDSNALDYPFFPGLTKRGADQAPLESFRRLIVRNSGNDWTGTLLRDAVLQHLVRDLPIDANSSSRPVAHFINGVYWGIMNLRERMDHHFLASHYDLDPDDVAMLYFMPVIDAPYLSHEPSYAGLPMPNLRIDRGTMEDRDQFLAMHDYAVSNDMAVQGHFDHVATLMDMESFAIYYAAQIYVGNDDWPQNNNDFWRKRTAQYEPDAPPGHDGRWRWMLFDWDFGFDSGVVSRNSLARVVENRSVGGFAPSPWASELFQNLLDNEGFRNLFISKLAQMATVFHPDLVDEALDAFNARIASYRGEHWARWGSGTSTGGFIRNFAQQRAAHVVNHVLDVFSLPGAARVSVSDPGQPGGWLEINGMRVDGSTPGIEPDALHEVPLFGAGSEWRFLDDGSDQGTTWRQSGFSDETWNDGAGAFGYGESAAYVTEIDYGGNSADKSITTYFRKSFPWADSSLPQSLDLELTLAGGAVVYLNGEEVLRHRLPDGEIDYLTTAGSLDGPAAVTGLAAWYAADGDMNTRTAFGSTRVTSWTDLSNNGSDAVQGTNSAQPVLVENELNGRPVVRFSGGGGSFGNQNNYLEAPIDDYRDGMTLFLVARVRENGGGFDSYLGTNGAGLGNVLYHVGSGGGRGLGITQPNVNLGNNTTFSSEWELIRIDADSTYTHTMTRVLSGDSVSVQLGNTGGIVNNLTLGASKHSGEGITDHLPVDIAEVLLYGRELNAGEILGAQRYLAVKYGLDLPEVGTFLYQVDAGAMTQGDNVLAVEVHLEAPFQDLFQFDMAAGANAVAMSPLWSATYFEGVPVTVRAVPRGGYRFVGWAGRDETDESLTLNLNGDVALTPLFEVDEAELGETIPVPHILSSGPYYFNEWPADAPAATYPSNMIFEQTSTGDPALTVPMDSYWVLPYNFDSRSRINGLGSDGFAFINTGNAQDHPDAGFLGSAVLALDTRGEEDIRVTWRAGTVLPNSRVYNLRLQYRIGDSGPFLDVLDDVGMPVEYRRNSVEGHTEVIGPVLLPAETEDRPLVQLRWKYYYTGVRLDPESGQRSQLRIDEILVSSGEPVTNLELAFVDLHPAGQTGKPLVPVSVTALAEGGVPDLTFSGDITISLEEGSGNLTGTLTRSASGGEAVFDDLVVDATGQYRLRAQTFGADPVISDPLAVASVTEVLMPRVIQGVEPDNNDRVPFAYRVRIDGLQPNATYRYGNRIEGAGEVPTQDGAGNMIFAFTDGGPFVRNTDAPDFGPDQFGVRHAEFTTDAAGAYEGWFLTEPTGNSRFTPGEDLRMRILLNDGAGGEDYHFFLSTQSPVRVVAFGDQSEQGSALYGESLTGPRNFLFLYDDAGGDSRPVSGTVVEATGAEVDERYAAFYLGQVAGRDGNWGTLIPNDLSEGILRVEERSLLDGTILQTLVRDEPFSGTVLASHGEAAVFADFGEGPVFLPQGDAFWNIGSNWSGGSIPNGAGEPAIIQLTVDNDRTVSLGQNITIGRLFLDNDTSFRNRLVGAGGGLTFQGDGQDLPVLRVGGFGTGFHELNVAEGVALNDTLRVAVDNVTAAGEYGALRIRENLTGPGGLTKEGAGVLSLTGGGKTYSGPTVVSSGVLRVTESSVPTGTSGVTVNSMGQLRLVSHGPGRVYTFGGDLTLNSLGPDEGPVVLPQAGRLGALRLDPELELRNSSETVHEGTVTNNIHFAGDSHLHVDGTANQLTLSGGLTGDGTLLKSGGGTVVLSGNSDLYTGGTYIMTGTLFVQPGAGLGSGPLTMAAFEGSEPELVLNNAVQTVSLLEGDLDDFSAITITLDAGTVLDVAQAGNSRFQGSLVGGGSLLKRGEGVLRLTRGPNTLLGTVSVQEGVLEITESSQPSLVSQMSVSAGGQLRLSSTGVRTYTFGSGSLSIEGAGIDPEAPASKGALRQEGSNVLDVATLTNNILLAGGLAGVHVNRDEGDGSTLILSGNLSGSADLFKTGGGRLVLEGANTNWGGGTLVENGQLVVQPGSRLGPGALQFTDPDRERRVELRQAEQTLAGLSGDVDSAAGGSLELMLAAGHSLTVNQVTAGLFAGVFEGPGSLTKTGPANLWLTGVSPLEGGVLVQEGALRVDGDLTATSGITIGAGGSVEGTGFVGALSGSGRVAPGGESAGILDAESFDPGDGLGAAFVFGGAGSPDYGNRTASGNDLLRINGESPFAGDLNGTNTVDVYLDVPGLQAGDEFRGGFFVADGTEFTGRIQNADFRFFLRDAGGEVLYRGAAYRPYSGSLTASIDTVAENGGRVMRMTLEAETTMTYSEWAASHFPDPLDETVAGPGADPDHDGVKNLMEYALGRNPLQASRDGVPVLEYTEEGAALVFYRDPNLGDITYVVDVSIDMENWNETLFDSRVDTQPNNQGHFMRIQDDSGEPRRFLRLRVILLE